MRRLAAQNGSTIKELVNPKSQAYKKLQPDLTTMDEQAVFELVAANPRIMVRPMLSDGKKMVMGFKEDQYKRFLNLSD